MSNWPWVKITLCNGLVRSDKSGIALSNVEIALWHHMVLWSLNELMRNVLHWLHYSDVIMSAMASQITSLAIVYSTFYSRRRSKKTSNPRVTGLCEGNSPVTGEFPTQRASNAENGSIWWRHHVTEVNPLVVIDRGELADPYCTTQMRYQKCQGLQYNSIQNHWTCGQVCLEILSPCASIYK